MRILLVEDEKMTRVALTGTLRGEGHEVTPCPDGRVGMQALREGEYDLLLTDLNLPGPDGLELLQEARLRHPAPRVIIMTAYASTETAVEALRRGAHDYVIKPFRTDEILTRIRNIGHLNDIEQENRRLKERIEQAGRQVIVGDSPAIRRLKETIASIAPGEYNVLIQGPSGTGKELAARAVHDHSRRAEGPFVAVNCSAIPDTLVESELFGYRKGAFTGADRDHQGYFARADGGSLFLDEVDDLPLPVQGKLLRVIQEREIEPVGGGATRRVDFRLITATKKDLKTLAERGEFRDDLYYRLNVIPLVLPTLAQRKQDIPALVEHFVARQGRPDGFRLDEADYRAMMDHDWPGNVRELGNIVERMLALPGVPLAQLLDGPAGGAEPAPGAPVRGADEADLDYRRRMQEFEEGLIGQALELADGNITSAARLLGLPRSTLRSKMEKKDPAGE